MMLSNVDFPDPDGPIRATISPCLMLMSTPLRTCNLFEPVPNVFVNPVTDNISTPFVSYHLDLLYQGMFGLTFRGKKEGEDFKG